MAAAMAFANPSRAAWGFGSHNNRDSFQPRFSYSLPTRPAETMEVDVSDPAAHAARAGIKRKADTQDNERLCKRVSLLNLEQNGERLYVPVEAPSSSPLAQGQTTTHLIPIESTSHLSGTSTNPTLPVAPTASPSSPDGLRQTTPNPNPSSDAEEMMRLDDTPHKVYIYDLDAELASSGPSSPDSDSDSDASHTRINFLPDLDKHLRATRIPKAVLRPDDQGMYAGRDAKEMQLVLYDHAPRSLSLPEDKDSVRRAILEGRRLAREEGERVQERIREAQAKVRETLNGMGVNGMAVNGGAFAPPPAAQGTRVRPTGFSAGFAPAGGFTSGSTKNGVVEEEYDDAMDLDL